MRSNGSPADGNSDNRLRMSRQRRAWVRSRRISSAKGEDWVELPLDLAGDDENGGERGAQFMGGGGGEPVQLGEVLLARQHEFGRRERRRDLAQLLGDLPGIHADISEGEKVREPDAEHVDARQFEPAFARPGQREMSDHEHARTGHRESREHQGEPHRQGGRRDQHRAEKQERERILQPAGEEQERGKFDNVDGEQPRDRLRCEPLVAAIAP